MNNFKAIVCSTFVFSVFLVITNLHAAGIANSTADNPTNKGFYRQLEGTIGNAKVEMVLTKIGNQLSGSYFYTKYKTEISLMPPDNEDNVAEDGSFTLNEYVTKDGEETHTGTFTGKLLPDGSITGTWKSADGKKIFPFELVKMLSTDSAEISIEYYSYPFYLIYEESIDTVIKNKKVTIKQSRKDTLFNRYVLPVITKLPSGNSAHLKLTNQAISKLILRDVKGMEEKKGRTYRINEFSNHEDYFDNLMTQHNYLKFKMNENYILSLLVVEFTDNYMSQPLSNITPLNFNLTTGNVIKFSDVFKRGSEAQIRDIITKLIREDFQIDANEPIDHLLLDDVINVYNFTITKEFIEFILTDAYISTILSIFEVPISELRHLLNPSGVITW